VLSAPRALFPVAVSSSLGNQYDAAPDGRRFLFSGVYDPAADVPLTLVANWDAELKKK
jgi:hypothetical protein